MTQGGSLFRQDFRTAYASVLWNMMVLRWCGERWDRRQDMAKPEARFAAIEAKATRMDLKDEMRQAAADNARAMATMRLDTRCNEGFGRALERTGRVLGELESFMVRRKQALQGSGDEPLHPPQNVRIAYLVVDGAFFALQECREPSIASAVEAQRVRFEAIEKDLGARLGRAALNSLRDQARMQAALRMVQPCAGEAGVVRLRQFVDRLADSERLKPGSG